MNIIFFLISILVFLLLIEIITVLFKLTGLSEEKARFQVVSLLTGSGFTTKESELITQHPTRRKLAQIVMVLGYLGFLTGISFLVEILQKSFSIKTLIIFSTFVIAMIFLLKNKFFLHFFDEFIEKLLLKKFLKPGSSVKTYKLINRAKGYGVYNILIDDNSILVGVNLKDSNLKPHNMIILNVDKGNQFIGFPHHDYIIEKGDNILLYGKVEEVIRTFHLENRSKK